MVFLVGRRLVLTWPPNQLERERYGNGVGAVHLLFFSGFFFGNVTKKRPSASLQGTWSTSFSVFFTFYFIPYLLHSRSFHSLLLLLSLHPALDCRAHNALFLFFDETLKQKTNALASHSFFLSIRPISSETLEIPHFVKHVRE